MFPSERDVVSKRPFEPLSQQNDRRWQDRWRANQGNWLLMFAGIVALGGVVVMNMSPADGRGGGTDAASSDPRKSRSFEFPSVTITPLPSPDAVPTASVVDGGFSVDGGTENGFADDVAVVPLPPPYLAAPSSDPNELQLSDRQFNVGRSTNPLWSSRLRPGTAPVQNGDSGRQRFVIIVRGARSDRGVIRIAIYGDADTFNDPDQAVLSQSLAVQNGQGYCTVDIDDLPLEMAVAAYHDENNNGQIDRNLLGIPQEPYGFTNRARGILGPPPFKDTVIQRPPPGSELRLLIRQ